MKNKLRLQRTLKRVLDNKQDITEEIPGLLGTLVKGKERVKVNSRKSFVYVRLHGNQSETVQAFNDTVSILYGLPVLVARVRNKGYNYRVIGKDVGRYQHWGGDTGQALLAPHGLQHSFQPGAGGSDIVWVFKKQFMPLLPYPYTGTSIAVSPDWYQWKESFVYFSGTIIDIGASKPAILGSSRFVTLYLEGSTNNVRGVTGSLFNSSPFPPDVTSYIPKIVPSMGIPLTSVLLSSDTTNVAWNNLYDDYRPIYGFGGDAAYSSGTVSTVGQTLYFTNEEVVVVPTITGSTSLVVTNLASANTDMGGMFGIGSPISTSYDVTLHTCVNNNNDIRYVAAGKWQATLNLIVQHPGYIGGTSGGIYLELWTQDSSTGAETLLSTSDTYSENAPSGWEDYRHTFFGVILSDVSLSATTRIFVRIRYKCPTEIDGEFVYLTLNVGGSYNSTLEFSTSFVFGGGHIIEDDGAIVAQRGYLNFVGDMFTAYDDGTATVVSGTANVSLGLTSGSIPFVDEAGKLTEDNNNLFWDNFYKQLYVGDNEFPFFSASKVKVINTSGSAGITNLAYEGLPYFAGVMAKGTKASPSAVTYNDGLCWVTATGHDGTDFYSSGRIKFQANEDWSATQHGTRMDIELSPTGSVATKIALSLTPYEARFYGTVLSRGTGSAGIKLDHNNATGEFELSLSPANLTANRRITFADEDLTLSSSRLLPANLTLTNANTSTLALNISSGKTLTVVCAGDYTFTIPNTGTAALLGLAQTFTNANIFAKNVTDENLTLVQAYSYVTRAADASKTVYAGRFQVYTIVNTGVTAAGSCGGLYGEAFRNSTAAGSNDNGTLAGLYGLMFSAGHLNTNASATPTTTTVKGIQIGLYNLTGVITTLYGLHVAVGSLSGGSGTNYYGIYIDSLYGATNNYAIVTNAGDIIFNSGLADNADFLLNGTTYPLIQTDSSDNELYLVNHASAKLSFFAATPVVKQTGCAVPTDLTTCIAAITALRTALNNYGLTTIV